MVRSSVILAAVEDFTVYSKGAVPPQVLPHLVIDAPTGKYLPVLFMNDFWCAADSLVEINETSAATLAELPLELTFSVTNLMRWMMTVQMQQSLEQQASMHGNKAMVDMHRMMTETSPWLLAVTAVVSILHTVFDMLAFKNDISFWRNPLGALEPVTGGAPLRAWRWPLRSPEKARAHSPLAWPLRDPPRFGLCGRPRCSSPVVGRQE